MATIWCGLNTVTKPDLIKLTQNKAHIESKGSILINRKSRASRRWTNRKGVALVYACTDEVGAKIPRHEPVYDVLIEGRAMGSDALVIKVSYAQRETYEYQKRRSNLISVLGEVRESNPRFNSAAVCSAA